MKGLAGGRVVGLFLVVVTLSFTAHAMAAAGARVTVEYAPPTLAVQVIEPTDLRTILEAICQRTGVRCQIASSAAEIMVPPLSLTGRWNEVLGQLLEGTQLNYASMASGPFGPGLLLVEARSPGTGAQPASSESAQTNRGALTSPDPWASSVGRDVGNPPAAAAEASSSPVEAEASYTAPTGGAPFVPPPGTVALPFPGAEGRPIVVPAGGTPPGVAPNPFSDAFGNPILTPPTGQPIVGSPFPGPNGQPIGTSPAPPGQGPPNPFGPPAPPK